MRTNIPLLAAAAILCLLSSACRKNPVPYPGVPHVQIRKVKMDTQDSAQFVYNMLGNPISITRALVGTGSPNYFFRYDARHRLTDYYGVYSDGRSYEIWHRYIYDNQNHIVADTMYMFGLVGDNGPLPDPQAPPPFNQLYVANISTYQYDSQYRIIYSTDTYGLETPQRKRRYIYGADGNLSIIRSYEPFTSDSSDAVLGGYDKKVNLHRTHPIWQFLDRDFSVNNRGSITAYNAQGLPLVIQGTGSPEGNNSFISLYYYSTLQITYQQYK